MDEQKINERNFIYTIKCWAVISIVAAHSNSVLDNTNSLNELFSWMLYQIGCVGVPVFFVISGYLFFKNKRNFTNFFYNKIQTIIIPWVFTGTLVYLYVTLRKGGLSLTGWFNFLIGNGSYLYYLSVLIMLYLLFFFLYKKILFVYIGIGLSIISIILTNANLLEGIIPSLNPFNYMIYFCIGLLIAEKNFLKEMGRKCQKNIFYILGIYVAMLVLLFVTKDYSINNYLQTFLGNAVTIPLIFGISTYNWTYEQLLVKIGKYSFAIYLLHMPVAGVVTWASNKFDIGLLTLFRPVIIIFIVMVAIKIYEIVSKKLKIERFTSQIIGVKDM